MEYNFGTTHCLPDLKDNVLQLSEDNVLQLSEDNVLQLSEDNVLQLSEAALSAHKHSAGGGGEGEEEGVLVIIGKKYLMVDIYSSWEILRT